MYNKLSSIAITLIKYEDKTDRQKEILIYKKILQ